MSFTPVAGTTAALKITPQNGNTVLLAAINWTGSIDPKNKDASNFRDGRFRLKTLQDSTWNFTVVHDSAAPEYLAANGGLVDGTPCTLYAFVSNSNSNTNTSAYIVPGIINTIGPKNEGVEGTIMVDVTVQQHNGVITYPSNG